MTERVLAPPNVLSGTRYRCREHNDQPVTFRGRGCAICTNQRQQSRTTRRQRRLQADEDGDRW
jgi:hypothetical protein